ncbi:MAG: anthranilate phosphoribosyltransferase [Saprospiraceae bacterium]
MRYTLEKLFAGLTLSQSEAKSMMDKLISDETPDVQVAAVLSTLRMRLPTYEELMGFRESLLEKATLVDLNGAEAIDMVGTGGDGMNTFNITTLSALTVAAAGYRVVKHGNGSASSKHGSSDTLKAAGFSFRHNKSDLLRQLDAANITFLHAPYFHPALGAVAQLRRSLGVGTIFNLLGPLLNPGQPKYNYIGVADARTQGLYAQVIAGASTAYNIVHSNDGYDEVTLTGPVRCFSSGGRYGLQARDFGLNPTAQRSIEVADDFTSQFHSILSGNGSEAQTDTVAANTGLAIQLRTDRPLQDCVTLAKETLLSGKASKNFEKLLTV